MYKTWEIEDDLFAPKRKVNNKGSRKMHHLIGSFTSVKMGKIIRYESLGERLFYYFLELDKATIRYYVQPVVVKLPNSWNCKGPDTHVPDVLVFRQGLKPLLYQIKDKPHEESDEEQIKNHACREFVGERDWNYEVIYPKTMPHPLPRNVRFLSGFLVRRPYYDTLVPTLLYRLSCAERLTVTELCAMMDDHMDPLAVRPLVYYLIAHGVLHTGMTEEIGPKSCVEVNEAMLGNLHG